MLLKVREKTQDYKSMRKKSAHREATIISEALIQKRSIINHNSELQKRECWTNTENHRVACTYSILSLLDHISSAPIIGICSSIKSFPVSNSRVDGSFRKDAKKNLFIEYAHTFRNPYVPFRPDCYDQRHRKGDQIHAEVHMSLFYSEKHAVKTTPQDGEGGNDNIARERGCQSGYANERSKM